jgi:Mg2+ and Co2+ transporter CorA
MSCVDGSRLATDDPRLLAILYDAAGHDREVDLEEVDINSLAKEQLLWVDLTGPDSSRLPEQMHSALGSADDPGSLEIFDHFYRFCIPVRDKPNSCLRFAVGQSWVLTASDHRPKFFDQFIEADQGETLKGKMTSTAFMASLLMRHLDGFREEIARVDVAIDNLDETILRSREKRSPLTNLAALRRKLSDLRAVLKGQRSVIHGLIAPDFLAHVSKSDREFLVEANRLFERLEDDIARGRETVIGSFELYASRVAQDTNQLIKVLTVATVITGVIGAVAGIFGMNFDTPIAQTGLSGFLLVSGAMIAVSVGIVAFAIWRRWV